jgi:hypothetical protein
MRRKNDVQREVEGVAQRLRKERPEASPLELDRIKTAAMSRTTVGSGGRAGARRLAVIGLTVGLLAATTGSVLAGRSSSQSSGNAAIAQYGNNCDTNNNGSGNGNGNNNNNFNCNEDSFNETTITNNVTNNYTIVSATPGPSVSATPAPSGGVLGSKTTKKARTSGRRIKIHVKVPRGARLSRVTVKVNGKRVKTLTGKKASANIEMVNLPCSKGATKIEVSVTLGNGKTVTSTHSYHLCVA